MKIKPLIIMPPIFFLSLFLSSGVYADMAKVINLAGKQRMLTQKMSKEALFIAKGIEVSDNTEELKKTTALFNKTLKGLVDGDADLGLDKTKDISIALQLDTVSKLWKPFNKTIQKVITGDTSEATLKSIAEQNIPLLKEMNTAVEMYTKTTNSNLDTKKANSINLAGKQRMLTQKMTKELLLVANGIDTNTSKEAFTETAALFEKTLVGLIEGDDTLGLPVTTDKATLKQMDQVISLWIKYKRVLAKIDVSDAGLRSTADKSMLLLFEMNNAVSMYEKLAKK